MGVMRFLTWKRLLLSGGNGCPRVRRQPLPSGPEAMAAFGAGGGCGKGMRTAHTPVTGRPRCGGRRDGGCDAACDGLCRHTSLEAVGRNGVIATL